VILRWRSPRPEGRAQGIRGRQAQKNTTKTTIAGDQRCATLWCGAIQSGGVCATPPALRVEGIDDQLQHYPQVTALVDAGYQGLAKDHPDQVTAPPLKLRPAPYRPAKPRGRRSAKPSPRNGSRSSTRSPSTGDGGPRRLVEAGQGRRRRRAETVRTVAVQALPTLMLMKNGQVIARQAGAAPAAALRAWVENALGSRP